MYVGWRKRKARNVKLKGKVACGSTALCSWCLGIALGEGDISPFLGDTEVSGGRWLGRLPREVVRRGFARRLVDVHSHVCAARDVRDKW